MKFSYSGTIHPVGSNEFGKEKGGKFSFDLSKKGKMKEFYIPLGHLFEDPTRE
jgi:hypothetical protein